MDRRNFIKDSLIVAGAGALAACGVPVGDGPAGESVPADVPATFPRIHCIGCRHCLPCPYGIDIPGIFAHYNKCLQEGAVTDDVDDPDYRKNRRRYLRTYESDVDPARAADKCISCGQCTGKCPEHIAIPARIAFIDSYVEWLRSGE